MSSFAVTVEQIAEVWPHPNADRLDLARLTSQSYQFVVGRGEFKPGDTVIYFPLDSVLPPSLIETLGLTGKLAGGEHNRVKTVRLRGEISQGIVASKRTLRLPDEWYAIGEDVTGLFGVTKYEPPETVVGRVVLNPLPDLVSVYDLENAEKYEHIVCALLDTPVFVTEKLDGSHFSCSYYIDTQEFVVCQRHHKLAPTAEGQWQHAWIEAARKQNLQDLAEIMAEHLDPQVCVTLRGEIVGPKIQGNPYRLDERNVYLFEIEKDGVPISPFEFWWYQNAFDFLAVPLLTPQPPMSLRAMLDFPEEGKIGAALREASNGTSLLNPEVKREGLVIRPSRETTVEGLGRLILKQRSPAYLVDSDC